MNEKSNISVHACFDATYVDWVTAQADVAPWLGGTVASGDQIFARGDTTFLRVDVNGTPAGGFLLIDKAGTPEVHTMLTGLARGSVALHAAKAGMTWVRQHKPEWKTVRSFCLPNRYDVLWFLRRCGFLPVPGEPTIFETPL